MKTKTIFKTLALAMLMPAMLLTTACSNSDDEIVNTENPTNTKGYALPITINVTRQGDATTRATFDGSKLSFSAGDKLFVSGSYNEGDCTFAGMLDYVSDGKFSGTIITQTEWTGTTEELLSADGGANATLLPAGYGEYGYLSIADGGTYEAYLIENYNKAFATSKATAVEQFSYEYDNDYSSGFELIPVNAILNFTINGLDASTEVDVSFSYPNYPDPIVISGKVTTDGDGTATFAIGIIYGNNLKDCTLTVDGNAIALPADKEVEAGKIYNITRNAIPEVAVSDLSMLDCAGLARASRWTANCYMVHSAGDYKLPLVYGNAIKNGATNTAAYTGVSGQLETFPRHDGSAITGPWIKDNGITVTTADLLWQDATGLVTAVGIDGDYLTLTVGKDADTQEGNAVVAAKDGSGNIVWSWHIWVTKQTFAAADLATVATGSHTYQLTPVNLGWVGDDIYTGTNTFYQWGRKDPFKGTGDVTFDGITAATIADNIKNPATFYNVSSKPSNTAYYNMWDAKQTGTDNITTATVKTVYDPSPAGFCVPTGNLYYYMTNGSGVSFGWDGTNKGRNLTSVTPNVFFPASGCRQFNTGDLRLELVGEYGCYWAASADGSNANFAGYLYFNSGWMKVNYSHRSFGFSVRPVAEE